MYDFHKTVQDPSHGEFRHEFFRQGRPDLLPLIKRKVSQSLPSGTGTDHPHARPPFPTELLHQQEESAQDRDEARGGQGEAGGDGGSGEDIYPSHASLEPLPSKRWQKRLEMQVQEAREQVRLLVQENQLLWRQGQEHRACLGVMHRVNAGILKILSELPLASLCAPAPGPEASDPDETRPLVPEFSAVSPTGGGRLKKACKGGGVLEEEGRVEAGDGKNL